LNHNLAGYRRPRVHPVIATHYDRVKTGLVRNTIVTGQDLHIHRSDGAMLLIILDFYYGAVEAWSGVIQVPGHVTALTNDPPATDGVGISGFAETRR
jgi:hypothetical protein